MCQRCIDNSVINRNNAEAALKLAQAAHTAASTSGGDEAKKAILARLVDVVELPQRQPETSGQTGEAGQPEAGVSEADARAEARRRIVELAKMLGISVEIIEIG